ncbi:transglycosylase domain-containing protein [Halalkalibacter alkaliphilus]|uniref:PBP1A family penicillin-binding protein n=1 Tax=Halalkalibacter alkaliphilus TaxID=2917993 RepID=A0A9X2CQ50_9BACI|nr:PBP1A family penicillin-binding protein [Halalkalibacter alkaliphilus]MCL7746982.1 PBP1A family penicillin-binding protein [Halalkalibacter alkaliphilus]
MKKKTIIGIAAVVGTMLFALIIYLSIILAGNYVIDDQKLVMKATTSLVDQNGEVLTQLYIENREPVAIGDIPEHVQQAFVSVEDIRFYDHQGIDIRAIGRALYRDLLAGAKVEGGSTITQQLAKNVFLTSEKTLLRKTNEVLIAMNLERKYSKSELLEMYLNRIYFGHGAYGIQAASKLYFNKDVNDLSIEEGALLAGLPKAPNSYSPIINPEQSKQRRDLVLTLMERHGKLNPEEARHLRGRTVVINQNRITENEAYLTYIDMVLDEARDRYHLTNEEVLTGGYQIVVPMNKEIQIDSYQKIQDNRYFPSGNEDAEAAIVLLDSKTGGVLAVQGGREYVRKGLNRLNVKRQPGSTIKPLAVYAPAMEMGTFHPYSMIVDELIDYDGYTPRNFNQEYSGKMTMYDAITYSANAPAVWLMNEMGVETSVEALERFGIHTNDRGLAIALGGLSEGVTPLELASAYSVFANNGNQVDPYFIEAIYTKNGERLLGEKWRNETIISPQTSWYMTRMLESVVKNGTGKSGEVHSSLAGKTGTTSFPGVEGAVMDAWFVGYTPTVVGAVWMGYDVTTSEQHLRGGSAYPTVLYKDMINELPSRMRVEAFEKPGEVEELLPPVELPVITDLSATFSMGGRGFSSIHLNWSGKADERIYYHIYENTEDGSHLLATVVGQTEFYINSRNPFTSKKYEVIPYNSITDQEGVSSNLAEVEFRLGFH